MVNVFRMFQISMKYYSFLFTRLGNLCIRKNPQDGKSALCLYDWEVCCLHAPQRDVAMFLSLGLKPEADAEATVALWLEYIEHYRKQIISALYGKNEELINKFRDKRLFMRIFDYLLLEVFVNRICPITYLPNEDKRIPMEAWMTSNLAYISAAGKTLGLDKC